jgi:hypothetical protein
MKKLLMLLAAALLCAPAIGAQEPKKDDAPPPAEEKKAEEAPPADDKAAPPAAEEKAAPAADEKTAEPKPDEKPAPAKKGAAKAEPKADGTAAVAAPSGDRGYVDAAIAFLKAYAHSNRQGEQGQQAWQVLKDNAADEKVEIKIAGKPHDLDLTGKKADARLMNFSKISTWREGGQVKGVTVDVLKFKVGEADHTGKGKVAMSEKGGKWVVESIEAE